MSFTRANPGGWSSGAELTTGQINQIDVDHAVAVDGSAAGDTIHGVITTTGGGSFQASTVGGIRSTAPQGIALAGGATDWPTFGVAGAAPRTKSRWYPIQILNALVPGWGIFNNSSPPAPLPGLPFNQLIGPGGGSISKPQTILLPPLHQGATLSTVTLAFSIATFVTPWAGQPGTQLAIDVLRMGPMTSITPAVVSLSSTTPNSAQSPGAISLTGGIVQSFTYTATQNNVIDQTQYQYIVQITDAYGTNAVANTALYWSLQLGYTAIANMQFA